MMLIGSVIIGFILGQFGISVFDDNGFNLTNSLIIFMACFIWAGLYDAIKKNKK